MLFISVIPIIIYLIVLKLIDSFSIARWRMLAMCMAYGAAICAFMYFILIHIVSWESAWVSPAIEELLKCALMLWLIKSRRIQFVSEGVIYGAAVGGGFSIVENTLYTLCNPDYMTLGTALFRGLGVSVMHMGCTALSACIIQLVSQWSITLFIPILIHYLHNTITFAPSLKLGSVLLIFLALFATLFYISDRKIYRWIDFGINEYIGTLAAIRTGNFSSTRAGQYLLAVKEQFQPEIFFDMICYVQIHYELTINRQSRMLMQQAGFGSELTHEQQKDIEDKQAELKALRRNIGATAWWVIQPLVRIKE